jgi:transposase
MRDIDLFQAALALEDPWCVKEAKFSAEARRLDLYLDFRRGGTFSCPECGAAGCKAHDTEEKQWRHLNFFQYEAYLHARTPRVRCARCGVRIVEVPWARPGSGFTLLFEAFFLGLVRHMPMLAVAELVGEHDTRLWRILHHYIDQARAEADFSEVRQVGTDETASRRGQNYISLFVDMERSRLLFATEGRKAEVVAAFADDLEAHGGRRENVGEFCIDLSAAFQKGISDSFPHARITFDKFHLVKLVSEAVDEVRREEQKSRPELKGTRWMWTLNPQDLTEAQIDVSDRLHLPGMNLKTVRAYHLRLNFQEIFQSSGAEAVTLLKAWYYWATHSQLPPMIRAAKTIRRHWDGVLRWFTTGLSNGVLENINGRIQAAKAKARGYRSIRNLIAMAYLIAGKLRLQPLPT